MRFAATVLAVAMTVAYPWAVWLGEERVQPRFLAITLIATGLPRLLTLEWTQAARWWAAGIIILVGMAIGFNVLLPLKFYPVFVNAALLAVFAGSLFHPPTVIERLARSWEGELTPEAVSYTRRVAQIWCAFFAFNGAVALVTALWGSARVWMLYNGLIAYVLIALLFAAEYCVRLRFKRRLHV